MVSITQLQGARVGLHQFIDGEGRCVAEGLVELAPLLARASPPFQVEVLVGRDKGKIGQVNSVIKERNWCFVEGLNCKYEWVNKTATNPGQMMKIEKPLLVTTEVALVDPSDNQATTIEWRYTETGYRVRVSTRTGRIIPFSQLSEVVEEDFINQKKYVENEAKDTTAKVLKKITYEPKLCSFEADIMEKFGIKEERKPAPTFWY